MQMESGAVLSCDEIGMWEVVLLPWIDLRVSVQGFDVPWYLPPSGGVRGR